MNTAHAERNSLRVMGLAGFASMASMRLCDPMLVVLGQEFQVTTGEASLVVSAFAVAYGVLQLFYGPLGDRFGKLRVISLAVLACAVFSAITSMASDRSSCAVSWGQQQRASFRCPWHGLATRWPMSEGRRLWPN